MKKLKTYFFDNDRLRIVHTYKNVEIYVGNCHKKNWIHISKVSYLKKKTEIKQSDRSLETATDYIYRR